MLTLRPLILTALAMLGIARNGSAQPYNNQLVAADQSSECCVSPEFQCGPGLSDRLWVRGDFLLWRTSPLDIPALVTTSPAGTPPATAGVLGQAGTQVLLGDELAGGSQSGGRITVGWWLNPCECRAMEANYFALDTSTSGFSANSGTNPILARPVFDTITNVESAMIVAHPNFAVGSINVDASTDVDGVEVLLRQRIFATEGRQFDFLFGYRFVRLEEQLSIRQFSRFTAAQGNIIVGTTRDLFDRFDTENRFHGVEFGVNMRQQCECWTFDMLAKLALGNCQSEVTIDGRTINTVPNAGSAAFVGGLLAQQTNIGTFERDSFGVLPEFGLTLSRQLTSNLRFSVGYSLLYWNTTLRPGDQIDRSVSQFPPQAPAGQMRPTFRPQSDGFLAHGLQLGMAYEF